MLKIGYLIPFTVIKNMPDHDSYLTVLPQKGILAQLPKKYARKDYRIGDSDWAAVFMIKGARITLSQKSPQYVRKMLESVARDLIQNGLIKFKKVAISPLFDACKVAVESLDHQDPDTLLASYIEKVKQYVQEKIYIIQYSRDLEEYIVNALHPLNRSAVCGVILHKEEKSADVFVKKEFLSAAIGKKAWNVITARKLTGLNITIKEM